MPKKTRKEVLLNDLVDREIYYFIDTDKNINQKSRVIFKKKDIEVHYPIGYNGGPRYKNTKKFIYKGFEGKLPVGVNKSAVKGLGFTRVLKPIMTFLEDNFHIEKIIILKNGKHGFSRDKKTLTLTESNLALLNKIFDNTLKKHKQENTLLARDQLHGLVPKQVKSGFRKYIPNSISSILATWEQSVKEFSENDKAAIKDLFDKLALTKDFLNIDTLVKTKETIDEQYIEDVIAQFKILIRQKKETKTLEKKWQGFLKKHSWIFSFIFSFPIILFEDEAYVGGKNISNKDGKVTDFLIKNNLTHNVAFIEIKTHKTQIFKKAKAYRGSDVFATSEELSGAISQVLNQRDNFQKEFAIHKMKSNEQFETFNSKCVVLIGSISELNKGKLKSFELTRSNSKDVDILTFDELLGRFENFRKLMRGDYK